MAKIQNTLGKVQILSGFSLKVIGVALMVIDHLYEMFAPFGVPLVFHMIGRACLPIFLFMVSEGFYYTHSRKKYLLRLLIGFWGMGLGNLLLSKLMPLDDVVLANNVFGTLFLSALYMYMRELAIEGWKTKKPHLVLLAAAGVLLPLLSSYFIMFIINVSIPVAQVAILLLPSILLTEGGFAAVILCFLFYLFHDVHPLIRMIPLAVVSIMSALGGGFQWMMIFAIIPLLMYNGTAGKKSKWFFYIFYPAHIYAFYMLSFLMHSL